MALEIDLSAATVVSSDITPINEVVDTPATQATPPLDLPDTTVIAQGFLAGTIDGSISGLGGIVGSGLNAAGFFGINDEHKLTYFLGSQSFDYSSSAYPELGQVEAGELRIGNDVSADASGALTGDSYLRYVPSTGLRIHNSAITISGPSGSIWVGDVQDDGTPDATGSGCGILDIGYYAINSGTPTFRLLNSGDLFAIGNDVSQDTVTHEFLGTKYLAYTNDRGLEIQGGSVSVNNSGFVWVGDDLGAYVRGETTVLPDGVGLVHNLDINGTIINGIAAIYDQEAKFSVNNDTGDVYLVDGTINIGSKGYIWIGDWTSSLEPDFTKSGVGIWSAGLGGLSNGAVTFFIDKGSGRFAFGQNVDMNAVTTTKGIYFDDYSNIICKNVSVLLPTGGYVWVGDVTEEHEINPNGSGVGMWSIGLAAMSGGSNTFYIDAASGHFAFGKNVDLSSVSTTKGVAYNGTNLTLNNIDLINKDSGGATTVEITSSGNLTLGSATAHQLKYTAADGNLTIDGANIGVSNSSYVWVGASNLSHGCGLTGGLAGWTDGFYATHSSDCTVFISAVDGSFTFGKTSGPHINYSGNVLSLIDTSIDVTGGYIWAGNGTPGVGTGVGLLSTGFYGFVGSTQTAFISATDGTFQFGPDGKCLAYDGSTLSLSGIDLIISDGHYTWVGTPVSSGIGLAEDVNGVSGLVATSGGVVTQYIKSDGTFQLGKSGGSHISFDGTTVALIDTNLTVGSSNYIWSGGALGTTGCGFYSGGFAGYYNNANTLWISGSDGSFRFGKTSGNNLSYSPSSGVLTLNGVNISDWANVSGSNLPEQNATNGATWGVNINGSNLPADNADVTADNPQPPDWLSSLISTAHLADDAVNAAKLAVAGIDGTTGNVKANHIVANMLQAGCVTSDKIYANAVTADKINVSTLSAISANLGTITAGSISADIITSGTLSVGRTEAKCTDPYADKTADHNAAGLAGRDTRNDDFPPSHYYALCDDAGGIFTEFKYRDAINAPGPVDRGTLKTSVPYYHDGGGPVVQQFYPGDHVYKRSGKTSWGPWTIVYDGADVTGDNTANDVEYGSGKAVYQYGADKTLYNTAGNTQKINDAVAENNYNLHMYGGADIKFYSDNGSTATGSIYSTNLVGQQIITVDSEGYLSLSANKDVWLGPGSGYVIKAYADIIPDSNGSYDLGTTAKRWGYIYTNYLGGYTQPLIRTYSKERKVFDPNGNCCGNIYGYNSGYDIHIDANHCVYLGGASGYGTYIYNKVQLPTDITCGSATHDSSHNFKLYYWHTGDGCYYGLDCYIANW